MNITTTPSPNQIVSFTPTFRITGASIYVCLLFLALWLNFFQLAVYIKGRKTFHSMAFFIIAWQLLLNDILICCVYIIFNLMILFQTTYMSVCFNTVLAFLESLAYNGLLCFAFLLCLNRLAVFATPKLAKTFFERPRIFGPIIFVWLCVILMVTGIMTSPCPIKVNVEGMYISPSCIDGGNIFNKIGLYVATYIPIVMLIIYFLIFLELKVGIFNNIRCCHVIMVPSDHSKQEIRLLLQSFLICGTFSIQNFAWSYLPFMTKNLSNSNEIVYTFIMLSSILLFTVDAIVVFTFNSTVKEVASTFFKRSTSSFISVYSLPVRRHSVMPVNTLSPWNSF